MTHEPNFSDYDVLSCIGSGEFGTCYKVQKKNTRDIFVWKAIDYGKMTERDKERIVSEVNLLSELNHPNIVHYYGRIIHKKSTTLYIIMECCEGGDLRKRIQKCRKRGSLFDERFIWHVLYQTARAVQACHSLLSNKTVLHRDIKPANVFLDKEGNVKLGDFGLARALDGDGSLAETCVGTPYYMSPEILRGEKYSRKSDVWSLGCLMYELCTFTPPFTGCNLPELADNIQNEKISRIPATYSQDLQNVISKMLTVKPESRPSIETILHHPTVVSQLVNDTFDSLSRETEKLKRTSQGHSAQDEYVREHQDLHEVMRSRLEGLKIRESTMREKVLAQGVMRSRLEGLKIRESTIREKELAQGVMRSHLEGLKIRESMIREKELAIVDRERALEKREKQVTLLDRMIKEKMLRADVYLNRCRDSRSSSGASKTTAHLDTSFSADPGDTSIMPTSSKMIPGHVAKPQLFLPKTGRHVHFDKLPNVKNSPHLRTVKNRKPFGVIQVEGNGNAGNLDKAVEDNFRNGVLAMFNNNKTDRVPASYAVERSAWLQNKRMAYKTVGVAKPDPTTNKENPVTQMGAKKKITADSSSKQVVQSLPLAYTKTASVGHYR